MKIAKRKLVLCVEVLILVALIVIILENIFQHSTFSLNLKYRSDSGWRIRSQYRQYAGRPLPTDPPPTPSAVYKRKAVQIADKCRKYSPRGRLKSAYHSLFVHEKKRFIYCLIHGVSPSKWSRVLTHGSERLHQQRLTVRRLPAETANRWRMDGQGPLVPLNRWFYTEEQIASRLSTYYKFAFFRHPLERLVAVYLHERYSRSTANAATMKPVVPVESRSNSSLKDRTVPDGKHIEYDEDGRAVVRDNEVSFADYVRNILKKRNYESYDPTAMFWRPQHALCQPCVIHYDFIGDYDVMNDDAYYVLDRIGIKNVGFPSTDVFKEREEMSQWLSKLMSQLSQDEIYRLKKFYSVDAELFNFTYT